MPSIAVQTLAPQDRHVLLLCRIEGVIKVLIRRLPNWLERVIVEGKTSDIYIYKRKITERENYFIIYKNSPGAMIDNAVIPIETEGGKWWREEVLENKDTDVSNFSNKFVVCSVRIYY